MVSETLTVATVFPDLDANADTVGCLYAYFMVFFAAVFDCPVDFIIGYAFNILFSSF